MNIYIRIPTSLQNKSEKIVVPPLKYSGTRQAGWLVGLVGQRVQGNDSVRLSQLFLFYFYLWYAFRVRQGVHIIILYMECSLLYLSTYVCTRVQYICR